MPNSDARDRFVYPIQNLMKDSYNTSLFQYVILQVFLVLVFSGLGFLSFKIYR